MFTDPTVVNSCVIQIISKHTITVLFLCSSPATQYVFLLLTLLTFPQDVLKSEPCCINVNMSLSSICLIFKVCLLRCRALSMIRDCDVFERRVTRQFSALVLIWFVIHLDNKQTWPVCSYK